MEKPYQSTVQNVGENNFFPQSRN